MKLDTFFDKFDRFADAPDAVAQIRELVLRLAVQGRLVCQSPGDEPAEALMARINEDRAAFLKANGLKRPRALDSVAKHHVPFALPTGWLWTRLGYLCRVQAGFAFESAAFVEGESGIPMIRIRDIKSDRTKVNYVGEYRDEFLVKSGDYLVAMDGNFTVARWRGPLALLNQRVSRLQWYSRRLEPSFFAIATQHRLTELQGKKAYTTVDHLSSRQIENVVVPVPPLAEQKRIMAKVDELMALCDRLEAQQREGETRRVPLARASLARFAKAPTPANLALLFHPSYPIHPADLRKSILTLAIQGKLVRHDPNDEPAAELLRRISAYKTALAREGRFRGSTSVPSMDADEAEYALPAGWAWVRLGDVMINRDGERVPVSKAERDTKAKTYDYYGASGVIDKIDDYLFDKPLLLIGEDGANLINRSTPIAFIARGKYWVNNHAHVLDGISEDFLKFIELHINAIDLERYVTGSAQPKMNQAKMNTIPIALPPLAEQRRIVAKVVQLMALVDKLETQLEASRATAVNLLTALVAELTKVEGTRR
jgi:type I restriction enzyme, S subunit